MDSSCVVLIAMEVFRMIRPTFSLSFDARAQLAEHVKQNGIFPLSLVCNYAPSVLLAHLTIEQCGSDVAVQVRLGETVNTLTVGLLNDTAQRVEGFVEELANAHYERMAQPVFDRDLEFLLRNAATSHRGLYLLPQSGMHDLRLLLTAANDNSEQTYFRFLLGGAGISAPMLMPADPHKAYELLSTF
ncbi:hypothetical protein APX70_04570, partial [Pseudomonas syringae pv. maculicola]